MSFHLLSSVFSVGTPCTSFFSLLQWSFVLSESDGAHTQHLSLSLSLLFLLSSCYIFSCPDRAPDQLSRSLPWEVAGRVENPYMHSTLLKCTFARVMQLKDFLDSKSILPPKNSLHLPRRKCISVTSLGPKLSDWVCKVALGSKVVWTSPSCCGWPRGSSVLTLHFYFCMYLGESGCPLQPLSHPPLPAPSMCSQ